MEGSEATKRDQLVHVCAFGDEQVLGDRSRASVDRGGQSVAEERGVDSEHAGCLDSGLAPNGVVHHALRMKAPRL